MKTVLAILFCTIIVSCSTPKERVKNTYLYYGKTACLGKCEVFDLYIYSDGSVMYNGIKNVSILGKKHFKISNQELERIKNECVTVMSLQKTTTKAIRDLPNTIIRFKEQKLVIQNQNPIKKLVSLFEKVKNNI